MKEHRPAESASRTPLARVRTGALFLIFFLGLAIRLIDPAVAAPPADRILVGLPNNVFANLYEGRPSGIIVETIDIILREMGKTPVYIVMPNTELNQALREGMVGIKAVGFRVPANAELGHYTDPIVKEINVIAVRADQNHKIERRSDLHGLRIGGRRGYLYPMIEADPEIQLVRFAQDGELMRSLIHGRVDAAIIAALSDVYKYRSEGVMARIRLLGRSVGEVPLSAVMSRQVFTLTDLAEFNRRLAALKAGLRWTEILERNGFADLVRDWPEISAE